MGFHYSSSRSSDDQLATAALKLSTRANTLRSWSHQFRKTYQGYHLLPEALDPLIVAAYFGHAYLAKKLISRKNSAFILDAAFIWASRMGHIDTVNLLIKHCHNFEEMVDGGSAFSWATQGGFLDIFTTLLKHDKNLINAKNSKGQCPLSLAVMYQRSNLVDELLDKKNVDVNLRDHQGTTPVFFAIDKPDLSTTEKVILVALLQDCRMDIALRDNNGRSILSYAAELGATEAIRLTHRERQDDFDRLLDDEGDKKRALASQLRCMVGTHRYRPSLMPNKKD